MTDRWPLPTGLGGVIGDALVFLPKRYLSAFGLALAGLAYLSIAILSLAASLGPGASNQKDDEKAGANGLLSLADSFASRVREEFSPPPPEIGPNRSVPPFAMS